MAAGKPIGAKYRPLATHTQIQQLVFPKSIKQDEDNPLEEQKENKTQTQKYSTAFTRPKPALGKPKPITGTTVGLSSTTTKPKTTITISKFVMKKLDS